MWDTDPLKALQNYDGETELQIVPAYEALEVSSTWTKQLGCWGQAIKKYGTSSTDMAWDEDDIPSTVEALRDTGQNLYIYPIDTATDYEQFLTLLQEPDAASLAIYASIGSWGTSSIGNIWIDVTGLPEEDWDPTSPGYERLPLEWTAGSAPAACTGNDEARWECDNASKAKWLAAWTTVGGFLSGLSTLYPNLKGFVINEFDGIVESPDRPSCLFGNRLTHSEVESIFNAAHQSNQAFEFIPTGYYTNLGRFLGEGYVLGANYGIKLHTDETMRVKLSFELAEEPLSAILTCFHATEIGASTKNVTKSVYVNRDDGGGALYSAAMNQSAIQYLSSSVDALHVGTNSIEFEVKASAPTTVLDVHLFWRIWDVTLAVTVGEIGSERTEQVTFTAETFWTNASSDEYVTTVAGMGFTAGQKIHNTDRRGWDDCEALPDNETDGFIKRRLVAGPNRFYLINDVIDGFLVTATGTDTTGEDDALDVDQCYSTLLESTKSILNGKKLLASHLAYAIGLNVDPAVLQRRLEIASSIADATIVLGMPIALRFMDPSDRRGVFAESAVITSGYVCMAFWPGRQSRLPGWYQRWVSNGTLEEGTLSVQMKDSRPVSSTLGILFKKIVTAAVTYSVDVASDGVTDLPEPPIEVTAPDDEPLTLALELGSSAVANWPTRVHYRVEYDNGATAPRSAFDFQSGIEPGATVDLVETYNTIVNVYQKARLDRSFGWAQHTALLTRAMP